MQLLKRCSDTLNVSTHMISLWVALALCGVPSLQQLVVRLNQPAGHFLRLLIRCRLVTRTTMNSYWRKTSWVKTSLHIPLLPDRTWMFLELTWWKCFCWWVKPGENPHRQNVKITFYLHQEKLDCNVITQLDKVVQNNCNLCFVHLHLHQWVWQ